MSLDTNIKNAKGFFKIHFMKFVDEIGGVKPVGHYSSAVILPNGFLFLSGQIANGDSVEEQTRNVLNNISKILSELGYSKNDIFKVVVYIKDISKFPQFNEVYKEFFGEHKPVRTTVEVSRLPKDSLIEIEVAAFKVAP